MKKQPLSHPYYLFIFPLFYALYLYAQNMGEINFIVVIRPILVLCILAAVLYGIFRLIAKSSRIAAFLSFLWLIFLLFYGSLYLYLKDHPVFGMNLGHHIIIGVVWVVLFVTLTVLILTRKIKLTANVVIFVNLMSVLLLLNAVYSIFKERDQFIFYAANQNEASQGSSAQEEWLASVEQPLTAPVGSTPPDIYYIIPDMFARSDAILAETGYDNSAFIQQLKDLGFYVAECSRSNYASTQLSIASSLNMNYLDQIQQGMTDRPMLVEPMSDSLVRSSLEAIGYQTVVFENGFGLPEIRGAAVTKSPAGKFFLFEPYNPFESLIVNNSFLRVFYDVNFGPFSRVYDRVFFPYTQHVQAQKYIFDELPALGATDCTQVRFCPHYDAASAFPDPRRRHSGDGFALLPRGIGSTGDRGAVFAGVPDASGICAKPNY